jgi:hypothetical protein
LPKEASAIDPSPDACSSPVHSAQFINAISRGEKFARLYTYIASMIEERGDEEEEVKNIENKTRH